MLTVFSETSFTEGFASHLSAEVSRLGRVQIRPGHRESNSYGLMDEIEKNPFPSSIDYRMLQSWVPRADKHGFDNGKRTLEHLSVLSHTQ